jgi:hypothetical protein
MKLPLQIAFQRMGPDAAIESSIRARARWLDHFSKSIMSCRVVVDRPHVDHKEGNLYQVRIDIKVPGGELAVTRDPSQQADHSDVDIMIRDAFHEMRRRLVDHVRLTRGQVKVRGAGPRARGRTRA